MSHLRTALWLVTSVAALGCNKSGGEQPAPSASASAVVAQAAPSAPATAAGTPRGPGRGPGHGGPDAMLFRAARDLTLTDDQKAKLDALEGKLHDRDTDPRDAMKTFSSDLATQVRAGKIEAAKLQPDEAALDAAMKGMLDKQAAALTGLHDALDAGQRKAIADAIHAKAAAREAKTHDGHDGGAAAWTAHKLDRMTTDLGLDAAQQKQVGALLAKQPDQTAMHDDMKKQMEALLTAFQADSFDATKVLAPTIKGPHDAMDKQIAFTAQLVSILHPDQREKLAASTMRPAGRGGPGGGSDDDGEGHGEGRGGGGGGGDEH